MFDKIAGAVGGLLGGGDGPLGGIGKLFGGVTDIFKSVMDSPLGGLLSMVFPGARMALQAASGVGEMLKGLSGSVGGGENY